MPLSETMFYFTAEEDREPAPAGRPAILFPRPCEVHGVDRLDRVYLHNGPDPDFYYRRRRDQVKFFVLGCGSGFPGCFRVSMGTNRTDGYAVFVSREDGAYYAHAMEEFEPLLAAHGRPVDRAPRFVEQNDLAVRPPEKIDPAVYDDPLWREYDSRCTGCGRCNVVCPTCTCFSTQDLFYLGC